MLESVNSLHRFLSLLASAVLLASCSSRPATPPPADLDIVSHYKFVGAEKKIVFYSLVVVLEEYGYTLSSVDLQGGQVLARLTPASHGWASSPSAFVRRQVRRQLEVELTASVEAESATRVLVNVDLKLINTKPPKRRIRKKQGKDLLQQRVPLNITQEVYSELFGRVAEVVELES